MFSPNAPESILLKSRIQQFRVGYNHFCNNLNCYIHHKKSNAVLFHIFRTKAVCFISFYCICLFVYYYFILIFLRITKVEEKLMVTKQDKWARHQRPYSAIERCSGEKGKKAGYLIKYTTRQSYGSSGIERGEGG